MSQGGVRSLLHLSLALQNFNKLFYCDSYFACFALAVFMNLFSSQTHRSRITMSISAIYVSISISLSIWQELTFCQLEFPFGLHSSLLFPLAAKWQMTLWIFSYDLDKLSPDDPWKAKGVVCSCLQPYIGMKLIPLRWDINSELHNKFVHEHNEIYAEWFPLKCSLQAKETADNCYKWESQFIRHKHVDWSEDSPRWSDHFVAISGRRQAPVPFQSSIKHTLSVIKGDKHFRSPLHQKLTLSELTFNEKAKQGGSNLKGSLWNYPKRKAGRKKNRGEK